MVYNNIRSNLNKVKEYFKNTNFVARLQLDLVYEAEKTRYAHNMQWTEKCNEYSDSLSDEKRKVIGESLNYNIYPEKDNNGSIYSIKFISKFGTKPNRELNDGVTSFLWLTSDYFLYSKSQKGIYLYDLTTGKTERLKQGNGEYELKEYKDGILKYDDMEEIINF